MPGGMWSEVVAAIGGGAASAAAVLMKIKSGREERFEKFREDVLAEVREERAALALEVAECRERDAQVLSIAVCFKMVLPEIIRLDPRNPILKNVVLILDGLPILPNTPDWKALLAKIDLLAPDYVAPEKGVESTA